MAMSPLQWKRRVLKRAYLCLTRIESNEEIALLGRKCEEEGIGFTQGEVPVKEGPKKGTLYIADSPEVFSILHRNHFPVAVYYHEKNGEESFPDAKYGVMEVQELSVEDLERIYRRFCNIPWFILETPRCILRETIEEDVEEFFRIYKNPDMTRYTEKLFPTIEEEIAYTREYRRCVYEFYGHGIWTILEKEKGQVIGRAGIGIREGEELPEIGFLIAGDWQKQGIATEVVREILTYGEKEFGYQQYVAYVHPRNEISLKLCRKLGFCLVGTRNLSQNGESLDFIRLIRK